MRNHIICFKGDFISVTLLNEVPVVQRIHITSKWRLIDIFVIFIFSLQVEPVSGMNKSMSYYIITYEIADSVIWKFG